MITGPTIGPGMALTVLMRWPFLIWIGTIGGLGTYAYNQLDVDVKPLSGFTINTDELLVKRTFDVKKETEELSFTDISEATAFVTLPVPAIVTGAGASVADAPASGGKK